MTNPTDIAAELERLGDQPLEAHHIAQWMEVNYHDLLAALRAAGEVGELRKALEKITVQASDAQEDRFLDVGDLLEVLRNIKVAARRAIAGSAK